jgi:hypothetical protein
MQIQPPHVQPAPVPAAQVQRVPIQSTYVAPQIPQLPLPRVADSKIHVPELVKPQFYKTQVSDVAPAVPKINSMMEALLRSASRLQSSGKAAWLGTVSIGRKVHGRGRRVWQSMELRLAMIGAGKQGQILFREGVTQSGGYARMAGTALNEIGRRSMARVQRMAARVNSISTTATTDVIRPADTQRSTSSRIRVLLAASSSYANAIMARRSAEWQVKRGGSAVDSRLRTSMILGAIAALIALVLVSAVPHYAAKSLPSRILNTNSSVSANVATPATAAAPRTEKPVPRKTVSAPSPQQKTASAKPATAPPHRAADDDYVAPNTYKYYGNGSKASR